MSYEEPLIMVTDYKITQVEQILPILELVAREARPLVIVAEDIEASGSRCYDYECYERLAKDCWH